MTKKDPDPTLALIAIILSIVWWSYLGSSSQPIIVHDAVGYVQLAKQINSDGILSYFQNGPNREPLYSLLIALSLKLGAIFHVSFITIQIIFQLFALFISQLLLYRILTQLRISNLLQGLLLLYFGFSASLTNAALSLFSEIIALPLILWLAIILKNSTNLLSEQKKISWEPYAKNGAALAMSFFACLMVKGIFELVFLICVIFLTVYFIFNKIKTKDYPSTKAIILIFTFFIVFEVPLITLKLTNYKSNGQFTYTDRGPWLLYGNMERRALELSPLQWKTALAYVPGLDFCELIYKDGSCAFWSSQHSDELGAKKRSVLEKDGMTKDDLDRSLMRSSVKVFMKAPLQSSMLMALEAFKIFFYETTHIGFVVYPNWLSKLYNNELFNQSIKFLIAILSFTALINTFIYVSLSKDQPHHTLITVIFLVTVFAFLHAPFLILPRYALPTAPLQIILIAVFLQKITARNKDRI